MTSASPGAGRIGGLFLRVPSTLNVVMLALAAYHAGVYAVLVSMRIGHPYVLEWQEGAMVDIVLRILDGAPIYTAPGIEFVPQIYAPLYFYVSALASLVVGEGFVALRLVSVLASLGLFTVMFELVRRETGSRGAGLLAVGLLTGCYARDAAWLDVGRVDSLFLFLAMLGALWLRHAPSRRPFPYALCGALIFAAAFFTKQQGLLLGLLFLPWLLVARGVQCALVFGVALTLSCTLGVRLFDHATQGWFSFYLFTLPGGHPLFAPMILGFFVVDLIVPLGPASLLAVYCIFSRWPVDGAKARLSAFGDVVFWAVLLAGGVGIAWGSRMHSGGAANVVLPAHACVAVAFAVAMHRLGVVGRSPEQPPAWLGPPGRRTALLVVAIAQLLWLVYDPRPLVPGEADRRAGDALVAFIESAPGEVWASWHGYLPVLAGKQGFAHRTGIHDVVRAGERPERDVLIAEILGDVEAQRFSVIVIDNPYFVHDYLRGALERAYVDAGPVLPDGLVVGGLLGFRDNPRAYRPRSATRLR